MKMEQDTESVSALLARLRASEGMDPCDAGGDAEGDAFASLMERYLPLIEKTVNRFSGESDVDRDDLRQEALMSFYRAAIRYDVEREEQVSFGLYAQICMTNRLISCVKRWKRQSEGQILLDEQNDFGLVPSDDGDDPSSMVLREERLERTYRVLRRVLSPFEYEIWGHYVGGAGVAEIAQRVGKSEKSVSNAIGRIRKKLKEARTEFDF